MTHLGQTSTDQTDGNDTTAYRERMAAWRPEYSPATPGEEWFYRQVVVNSLRVEHCQNEESALRRHIALRARHSWDEDRRLEAEETAASLSIRPALKVRRLLRTKQGCDCLIKL